MPAVRVAIAPNQTILDLLDQEWPLTVPKHRLMRIALEAGLRALADLDEEAFRHVVTKDAVASAGIRER
ncbi:MAG TPA: hypothetical protein VFQ61_08560 [Polyangiaceae bacterium]|nr:hypothetical protein [Polyangiaceae bacterium]